MTAFICNYHQHWYTIRKIGRQWFNLDSTIKQPRLLSDMYLELYLAQIKEDGMKFHIYSSGNVTHYNNYNFFF